MSRSGYVDECDDNWSMICWRGAVKSAIRGKRGQKFLTELLEALDNMTSKRLIKDELEYKGEFCALGVIGLSRGVDMENLDPDDSLEVAKEFNIAESLAREIVFENDEGTIFIENSEQRWVRVRAWVASLVKGKQ